MKTCKGCIYFYACGDVDRKEPCKGKAEITKGQAKEFYHDLCGTVYGSENKNSCGVMSIGLIADHMNISIEKANAYCDAMIKYGITDRQSGMIVV